MNTDALKKAMDLLARREHSRHELSAKLTHKGFAIHEVDAALDRLQSEGLQSDERFAESYTHHRMQAGYGPLRIVQELKARGVDDALIDAVVWQSDRDWLEHLRAAWQKKYSRSAPYGSKDYATQLRFLMQRGFMQDAIHQTLQSAEEQQ